MKSRQDWGPWSSAVSAPAPEAREDASDMNSVVWMEGPWGSVSSDELRSRLLANFDPALETLQTFDNRFYHAVSLLEGRGEDPGASSVQRAVLRARYSMETASMAPLVKPGASTRRPWLSCSTRTTPTSYRRSGRRCSSS